MFVYIGIEGIIVFMSFQVTEVLFFYNTLVVEIQQTILSIWCIVVMYLKWRELCLMNI